ncbi:MAG: hypothetical protein LIP77_10765 [Planctomycetes bacterium]|nr:hypothetical protein [Planctomycetota bacterium]
MNVTGTGGSPYLTGGMVGVGVSMLNAANKAQTETMEKLLPLQVAENAGRAASEARGLFVDTYA